MGKDPGNETYQVKMEKKKVVGPDLFVAACRGEKDILGPEERRGRHAGTTGKKRGSALWWKQKGGKNISLLIIL